MSTTREPLAVVGLSAIFPGSVDRYGFWNDIFKGRDLISAVPETHWLIEDYYDADPSVPDKTYGNRGGFLSDIDFDPISWGVPPNIMSATDTTQLIALIVAKRCLEDACAGDFEHIDRDRVSVILGATSSQELLNNMVARLQRPVWVKALREHGVPEAEVDAICNRISSNYVPWQESTFPGLLGNVIAGRIANRLDLGGTNCVTDAACASTFSAVTMAASELYLGDSDLVLVGGADTMNDIFMHMCFSKTPALSKTGDVRPFSDKADGTLLGEGVGMFALRRLSDAEASGDPIYAILSGVGSSSDGRAKSVYAPRADGQAKAIRRAYDHAGISAAEVELIEAHGTGTKAGDAAEFGGLKSVFEESGKELQWCALGSVKSQIGHTKAAAGAAGMFKAVLALHQGVYPPTIKVNAPNPNLDIENSPFYINTKSRPWIHCLQSARNAGVSALGFGGSNFHLALQSYNGPSAAKLFRNWDSELFLWAADNLDDLKRELQGYLKESNDTTLAHLAKQCAESPVSGVHRLGLVADTITELQQKIEMALSKFDSGDITTPDGVHYHSEPLKGKVAFLFPGQGSQHLEMGADLVMAHPIARLEWDALAHLRYDDTPLHQVVFPPPVFDDAAKSRDRQRLTQTEWAQPAIGMASLAVAKMLSAVGLKPDAAAGHSYGELSALHMAGVFNTEDYVQVSRKRGELMRDAAKTPGSMTAVKAKIEKLTPLLDKWNLPVVIANHNSPRQCVLSGPTKAIELAENHLKEAGITAQRLNVATAFHSNVVSSSVKPFFSFLKKKAIRSPNIPVYANSTTKPYPSEAKEIRNLLANQIASSVRYVELIERMVDDGVRCFVEVGPRQIQTRLVSQILRRRKDCVSIATDRKGKSSLRSFLEALAQIHSLGHSLDTTELFAPFCLPPDPRNVKPAKLVIPINGANYAKPYPPPGGAAALPEPNPPKPPKPPEEPMAKNKPSSAPQATTTTPEPSPKPNPHSTVPSGVSGAWLAAFQQAQQQTAQAHTAYQNAMAQAHVAYLQTMQTSLQGLAQLAGGTAPSVGAPVFNAVPTPVEKMVQQPMANAVFTDHAPVPVSAPAVETQPAMERRMVSYTEPAATTPGANIDLNALLLSVVSEKTGYPQDALSFEMSLEGDLGIDSIKRVEILSAVQEQAPSLPEVDAGAMAQLQTLGQIVEYLGTESTGHKNTSESPASLDLNALLLSVVAEKTGYPEDALNVQMSLEGDLGIDSIKRVEILSAVQERAPSLPEVDAGAMAQLQTLGQIIDYLSPRSTRETLSQNTQPSNVPLDVHALLLSVVSEKTGYPEDALNLEMSLEGDLGIDSIKRVEILSAVQERAPSFPEVDAAAMAQLQTLGQIVGHMQEQSVNFSQAEVSDVDASAVKIIENVPRYRLEIEVMPPTGLSLPSIFSANIHVLSVDERLKSDLEIALRRVQISVALKLQDADFIIDLRPLQDFQDPSIAQNCALDLLCSIQELITPPKGVVAVLDMGGTFGTELTTLEPALAAGVAGVVKTAAQEWSNASCKVIDLDTNGRSRMELSELIVHELIVGGTQLEVGYPISGKRVVPILMPAEATDSKLLLGPDDICVVSGGGRGVTAETMVALAEKSGGRFALLGRTVLNIDPCPELLGFAQVLGFVLQEAKSNGDAVSPKAARKRANTIIAAREIAQTLKRVHESGGQANYYSVDVTDFEAVADVCQKIRNLWGPITAVVHGAGVLADKRILEKNPSDFEWVYGVKVNGANALLAAMESDPLKWICFFSSVAARSGNQGQSDYAAANETLNKMAWYLRNTRPNCVVKTLGWGPWEGGMVTPALKSHFESRGVPLIPLSGGARALCLECQDDDAVELILGGVEELAEQKRTGSYTIFLHELLQPELLDHQIQGSVVLPMALVLEYFVQAARAFRPSKFAQSIHDFCVLKGIKLEQFSNSGQQLQLTVKPLQENQVEILLQDNQTPLYTAQIRLADAPPKALESVEGFPEGRDIELSYGHALFHGPRFQMIEQVVGNEHGYLADLSGAQVLGWHEHGFACDPVGVDAALQLALLWREHQNDQRSVPMRIARIELGASTIPAASRCVFRAEETAHARQQIGSAYLLSNTGRCTLALHGIKTLVYGLGAAS